MTALAWGAKVSPEFRARVLRAGARLGVDPSWLMAVMAFESGKTFRPDIRNEQSGATGLIQFMPATARDLDTTTDALAAMSAVEQLDYVERYFARFRGRLHSLNDSYMAVLWPRAVGEPDDYVLFAAPSTAYAQNRALDTDYDGRITKREAAGFVARALADGMQYATQERDDAPTDAGPLPDREDTTMVPFAPILASLLPSVLNLFSARAQQKVQKAAGVDADTAKQFTQDLFTSLQQAVGIPITDDATAIQAVGKLTGDASSTDPAIRAAAVKQVAELEQHALDYLDRIAPLIDKIAQYDLAARTATDASFDAAAKRLASPEGWRLRFTQVSFTQWGLGVASLIVGALTAWQMWVAKATSPDPALMVLLTAIVMGLVNTFRDQTGFSFGGTVQDHASELGTRAVNQTLDRERAQRQEDAR